MTLQIFGEPVGRGETDARKRLDVATTAMSVAGTVW
jgi:hypothetical protein